AVPQVARLSPWLRGVPLAGELRLGVDVSGPLELPDVVCELHADLLDTPGVAGAWPPALGPIPEAVPLHVRGTFALRDGVPSVEPLVCDLGPLRGDVPRLRLEARGSAPLRATRLWPPEVVAADAGVLSIERLDAQLSEPVPVVLALGGRWDREALSITEAALAAAGAARAEARLRVEGFT